LESELELPTVVGREARSPLSATVGRPLRTLLATGRRGSPKVGGLIGEPQPATLNDDSPLAGQW